MGKEVNTWNWYGHLTVENLDDVAQALNTLVEGKQYTMVCTTDARDEPEVRLHQHLTPENTAHGYTPIHTSYYAEYNSGSIGLNDTYGVYSIHTGEDTWICFEWDKKCTIKQVSGSGNHITWVIVLE